MKSAKALYKAAVTFSFLEMTCSEPDGVPSLKLTMPFAPKGTSSEPTTNFQVLYMLVSGRVYHGLLKYMDNHLFFGDLIVRIPQS